MKWTRVTLSFLSVLAFGSGRANAQVDTGTIVGTIRDASGAVVPGATVVVTETTTNTSTQVVSDSLGSYIVPSLKVGTYSVTAELSGFKKKTRENVVLRVQDRLRIDFDLDVGDFTETVVVEAVTRPVQTEASSLGEVIDSRQIVDLPLNGRNFVTLGALTTGVAQLGTGNNGNAGEDGTLVANGARASAVNYILDGIDNNNNDSPGQVIVRPNVDAIEEFKVQTSNYSAEFGRSGGGVINVVMKSGANSMAGSAFYFLRDESLDSRDYFLDPESEKPPFGLHQFGGTFGGPIRKDKTFFFANFQGTRTTRSDTLTLSVPTAAMRHGDFSQEGNPAIIDPTTGEAFPGNIIPSNRFDPLARNFVDLYPDPTGDGLRNNYLTSPTITNDVYQGDVRIDHLFSAADRLLVRLSISHNSRFIPAPLPGLANGGDYGTGDTTRKVWGGAFGWSKTFSEAMLNDLRIGFNWLDTSVGITPGGQQVPPPELQVPGVAQDSRIDGITVFAPDSYAFVGDPEYIPTYTKSREIQFSDALTLSLSRHTLKVGAQIRQSRFALFQIPQPRGAFRFSGEFTGDPLADALLGLTSQLDIQNISDVDNRTWVFGAFAQDDFKVSQSLVLNLGLRYDYTGPTVESQDRQANFDYATGEVRLANQEGNSSGLIEVDKLNFAPRVGFAWSPGGRGTLAVRGGYGVFFNNQEPRTAFQLGFNPPFFFSISHFSDFGVSPAGLVQEGFPSLDPADVEAPGLITVDERFRSPYYQQWNLAVEHALPGNSSIEVAYVGSKGSRLQVLRDPNQPPPAPGDVQERRPFPEYGNFAAIQNAGRARYDGLQVKLMTRFSGRLWLLSAYTYGHAKSDQGEIGLESPWPANSLDVAADYGRSDADQRHRWITSFAWDLPYEGGGGGLDAVLDNWQLGGIVTLASGFPFSPLVGDDTSNTGTFGSVRPDLIGEGELPSSQRSIQRWFNVDAYQVPEDFTFGNAARNSLEGPGLATVDFYVEKRIPIGPKQRLELRIEMFNLFNRANFGLPDPYIDDGEAAGTITSLAVPMREIQFGARFVF